MDEIICHMTSTLFDHTPFLPQHVSLMPAMYVRIGSLTTTRHVTVALISTRTPISVMMIPAVTELPVS